MDLVVILALSGPVVLADFPALAGLAVTPALVVSVGIADQVGIVE